MQTVNYTISNHAKRRYAERVMGRNDEASINQFISDHEDKIEVDINKMLNYGTLLYSGKTFVESKDLSIINDPIDVFCNGLWILFVNNKSKVVITLYKINLGAGEDIDRQFVESLIKSIRERSAIWDESKQRGRETIDKIHEDIEAKNTEIAEYRSRIKILEEVIEGLRGESVAINKGIEMNEKLVRDVVLKLIGKKFF